MTKLTTEQLQRANVALEKLQVARNALDSAMGELRELEFYRAHTMVGAIYDKCAEAMEVVRKRAE